MCIPSLKLITGQYHVLSLTADILFDLLCIFTSYIRVLSNFYISNVGTVQSLNYIIIYCEMSDVSVKLTWTSLGLWLYKRIPCCSVRRTYSRVIYIVLIIFY